jgi:hypothetical protein
MPLVMTIPAVIFHSSSVAERPTVNRMVVGSTPTCGAIRVEVKVAWASQQAASSHTE